LDNFGCHIAQSSCGSRWSQSTGFGHLLYAIQPNVFRINIKIYFLVW
jgi:hypothetical protein